MFNIFLQILDSAKLVEIIRRELGTDTGNKSSLNSQAWILLGLAVILCFLGLRIYYFKIWRKNRQDLPNGRSHWKEKNNLSYIVSFTPNGKVRHHIVAGLCVASGLSIGFSYIFQYYINLNSLSFHANVLSIAGMFFAILTTSITFWTLNQTKKLEHEAGLKIFDFTDLIRKISIELEGLLQSFNDHPNPQRFHRIYIVTEHIFFGQLSYPVAEFTRNYAGLLNSFREINREATLQGNERKVSFEIICGDTSCIRAYIEKFHGKPSGSTDPQVNSDIQRFEENIKSYVDQNIAHQFPSLLGCRQFAVVGDVVFEFMIESLEPATSIIETHTLKDKKKAELFIQLFDLMKKGLSSPPPAATSPP